MTRARAAGLLLFAATSAWAGNGSASVAEVNRLYDAGKFQEAVEGYDKLLADLSGRSSPEQVAAILFNRGDALYRLGSYSEARDSYEEAAIKTRVLDVEAKATYNMGNCFYREAEAGVAKGNLQQAVQSLGSSIAAYRRTLELDPTSRAAAENLEVARTVLKGVRDQLAKYGDIEDLQREIVETLKRLISTQEALIRSSGDASVSTAAVRDGQAGMRSDTRKLLGRFDALLQRLAQLQGSGHAAGPHTEARRHVSSSSDHQGRAVAALESGDRSGAASPQSGSLEELKKALEILTPPEREDRSQQGQSTNESGKGKNAPPEQSDKKGTDEPRPSEPDQTPQGEGGGGSVEMERAEDILQEEGDNRRASDTRTGAGAASVDKDW